MSTTRAEPVVAAPVPRLIATDADFLLRVSPEGLLLAASDNVATILGWDLERCVREGLGVAIGDEAQRAAVRQMIVQVLATGGARTTLQVSGRSGSLWIDVAAKHLLDEPGTPILISARDVSDDLMAATQLAASEQQWRLAFEHSPIGGALLDAGGGILVVNEALCRTLGWQERELTRMDVTDVVVCQGGLPWQEWWNDLLDGAVETSTADRMLRTSDGRQAWGRLTAAPVTSAASPARIIMQMEDITGRREAELELANRACTTG